MISFFKPVTKEVITKEVTKVHQRCSIKKGVLGNFTKFTGNHLCQSLFVNKVTGQRDRWHRWHSCFPVNIVKFLRTPFLPNTSEWLRLKEISNLKPGKAVHSNDTPILVLKDFEGIFTTFIHNNYNKVLMYGTFPEDLKQLKLYLLMRKNNALTKIITDP